MLTAIMQKQTAIGKFERFGQVFFKATIKHLVKTGAESHEIFTTGEVVLIQSSCADPESFVREGPTLTFFYFIVF